MAEGFANDAESTLSAAVTDTATSIPLVNAGPPFPATPFRARIDDEYVIVTGGRLVAAGAGSVTVTRGAEGTSPAAHAAGASFTHILTAGGLAQGFADQIAGLPASNTGAGAGTPALRTLGSGPTQAAQASRTMFRGASWHPSFNNLKAANMPPEQASSTSTSGLVQGTAFYAKVRATDGFTVANIAFGVQTAQVGATYAHVGLFSADGATQLVDVDLLVSGHLNTIGAKLVPVASGQPGVTAGAAGALDLAQDAVVYVGILTVGATTVPALYKSANMNANVVNIGLAASDGLRWATVGSQTTLGPAPVATMAAHGLTHFFGLA